MPVLPISEQLRDFYRTTPMREGVVCWYPFKHESTILDYSNGILTDFYERRGLHLKNKNEQYVDYIVMLDPVDYTVDMLRRLKHKLLPKGRLLIAYENPFALRFWAGAAAPGTGRPYDTLLDKDIPVLPSKSELAFRLDKAGFNKQKWYYFPSDHWFAREVYSDDLLPNEYLNQRFTHYLISDGSLCFDERSVYREVIRGNAFTFMCGAFLVEACVNAKDKSCEVDYAAITSYRAPSKRYATVVKNDNTVHKIPLTAEGKQNIHKIHDNHKDLTSLGLNVLKTRIENDVLIMPRINLPTLWDYWAHKLSRDELDENILFRQYDSIVQSIKKSSVKGKAYWELVPANCFYDETKDELLFFDQEFYWKNASLDIAIARALFALTAPPVFRGHPKSQMWLERLLKRYGLSDKWEELYNICRRIIHDEVFGNDDKPLHVETAKILKQVRKRISTV